MGTLLGPMVGLWLGVGVWLPVLLRLRSLVPGLLARHGRSAVRTTSAQLLVLLPFGEDVLPVCVAVPGGMGPGNSQPAALIT